MSWSKPHQIEVAGGVYRVGMGSSFGNGSHKLLTGVLTVDEDNGWKLVFEVTDHGETMQTPQLSTAVRLYNEAA